MTKLITDKFAHRYKAEGISLTQPTYLNFHNLSSVCANALEPRIIADSDKGVNYYWASNERIVERLQTVFVNMQTTHYKELVYGTDIYPVVYKPTDSERNSPKCSPYVAEKDFLCGVFMDYKSKMVLNQSKYIKEFIKEKDRIDIDSHRNLINISYGIYLDHTQDDNFHSISEMIAISIISALNQHRRIKYVPHETLPITIKLTESMVNLTDDSNLDINVKFNNLVNFILAYIEKPSGNNFDDDAEYVDIFSKISEDIIRFDLVDDTTKHKYKSNLPLTVREVYDAYSSSYGSNIYGTL